MSPPSAVILSASARSLGEAGRRLVRVEPGLLEQVLVVEERRDVGVERHAVEAAVIGRDHHVAGAGGLQLGPVLDLVGDVDELPGLLELRRVDQVHAHQVGHVAARRSPGRAWRPSRHAGCRSGRSCGRGSSRSTSRPACRPCPCCRRFAPTSPDRRQSPAPTRPPGPMPKGREYSDFNVLESVIWFPPIKDTADCEKRDVLLGLYPA